jgi:pimeloyl-ACP methyl ester carboxylesterase
VTLKRVSLRLDAGVSLPDETTLQIAADVFLPDAATHPMPVLAWVCLPGGGMKRQYFDLPIDESFSFARQMATRGFVVVLIDHLGIGESSRPADGYALNAEVVTTANANATTEILSRLREGRLSVDVPAFPQLCSIGLGHSMGAMMTTLQQAQHVQHIGVALLGFSTRGLPEYLPSSAKAIAHDLPAAREQSPQLAKMMFGSAPYPVIKPTPQSGAIFGGKGADPRGGEAIKAVSDALLPVLAFQSMLPGNVLPEARQIQVPVFLGLGEKDMAGPPHEIPASFSASIDVTLYVMPGAGHSHFLFPIRLELFDRLADWAQLRLKYSK